MAGNKPNGTLFFYVFIIIKFSFMPQLKKIQEMADFYWKKCSSTVPSQSNDALKI